MESYIYAIKAVGTSRYKIGTTTDLKGRLATVQTGCPYPAQIVATWEGDRRLEAAIHRELADVRKVGEWFEVELEEIERAVKKAMIAVSSRRGSVRKMTCVKTVRKYSGGGAPQPSVFLPDGSGFKVDPFSGWNKVKGKPPWPDGWELHPKGMLKVGGKVFQGFYYHWVVKCPDCRKRVQRRVGKHFTPRQISALLGFSPKVQIGLVRLTLSKKAREIAESRYCSACQARQLSENPLMLPPLSAQALDLQE